MYMHVPGIYTQRFSRTMRPETQFRVQRACISRPNTGFAGFRVSGRPSGVERSDKAEIYHIKAEIYYIKAEIYHIKAELYYMKA